jgi:hypoxia up-regulated 1
VFKDCVITVPSSFTQHEREAVYTAADIADLKVGCCCAFYSFCCRSKRSAVGSCLLCAHYTSHGCKSHCPFSILIAQVLTLIEENTAAAVHYALDRTFDTPANVMFFNMGAGSVQVTVAQYSSQMVKEAGKNKTIGQFEVVGKAWDASLGGFNFDVRLAELLADRFNAAWGKKASGKGKDLRDFNLPMTKLRVQANKVKEILSANAEFPVKAEQLHADVDLNTKVTRAEFEAACEDLFARITAPIDAALLRANLTLADLHSVELLGGGVRMPRVKKILDGYFSEAKVEVGQHLNGDEAMAMGAAFRAANLSTAFRVRKIGASDISSFGVSVRLNTIPAASSSGGLFGSLFGSKSEPAKTDDAATEWTKFTGLYPARSSMPAKSKTVAFTYDQDIACRIEYDANQEGLLPAGTDSLVAAYNITGVAAFNKEHANKNLGAPKVHLSFGLDSSGLVTLLKAEATLELPAPAEESAESAASAAENSTAEATKAEEGEAAASTTEGASTEGADSTSASADNTSEGAADKEKDSTKENTKDSAKDAKEKTKSSKSKEDKKKGKDKPKDRVIRKALKVEVDYSATRPPKWSPAQIATARTRRYALKEADDLKKATEAALNELEGYIYRVKNEIADREEELKAVSTEEQRQEVVDMANAAEEWLYDEGRGQSIAVYNDRQKDIRTAAEAIFKRHKEVKGRTDAVTKARKLLQTVTSKVETWEEKMPHITSEEKEKLLNAVKKAEAWIAEKLAAQEATSPYEAPAFESSEVPAQLKPVSNIFEKLLAKPKPAPPVVDKVSYSTLVYYCVLRVCGTASCVAGVLALTKHSPVKPCCTDLPFCSLVCVL